MRIRVPAILLLLAPLGASAAPASPAVRQLLELEQTWLHAASTRDIPVLKRILSPDYLDINYLGRVRHRAQALRAANVSGAHRQTLSEERVRFYGNTAIVTGRGELTSHGHRYAWRFTDVFVARSGHWRAVSSQETPVHQPAQRRPG